MAATKSTAAKKSAKPMTAPLSKSGLVAHLSTQSGVDKKGVQSVLEALEQTIAGSIHKKGAGQFTMPGLFKITAQSVPAKPRRQGIDPFTKQERWFDAKPASVRVKIRPLKKLKDAAA